MTAFAIATAFLTYFGVSAGIRTQGGRISGPAASLVGRLTAGRSRRKLAAEVAPAIRLFADSLDSGLTIPDAALRVGEGGGAASSWLRDFAESCRRGMTVSEGLVRLTARHNGDLWSSMAFTVELHFRQGGDLAESLRQVANQLEAKEAGRMGTQSATAQARFTANVVCGMPLFALGGAALIFPGRVALALRTPASLALLTLGLVVQAGSLVAIRRIAS